MVVMKQFSGLITTIQRLEARAGLDGLLITTDIRLEGPTRMGGAALRDSRPAPRCESLGVGLAPGLA